MITFRQVSRTYPHSQRPALDHLDLEIDQGEFCFLIGPSGSGKSTLFNLLMCEEDPTEGEIEFDGTRVDTLRGEQIARHRRRIGYVFQNFRLLNRMSVRDNIAFALEVIDTPRAEIDARVDDALATVGLADKAGRFPRELSGGEQQRAAIARAFVNKPQLLLADEPTGNLDPDTADEIMELINRLHADGATVLMSTHNERAVDKLPHRILAMRDGKIVRDDYGTYHQAEED
ncbi:cell division ATP-binding protein FtsE [Corynebacterium yudongzhengii]|uniref:Cell division ATP-binding protein FtsE n=1 Tax=Corynebacterium yudongzhengii TaxID=2080740 RepID=A0A2U1T4B4_9CORY|nr:cell division ATP-binding protein FtsE [Corynebacterium yudongzhengii]AWB82391.1 cell division ATP-binding protein FtsE [Corynebacterium yudongzhengii]PWC00822.1 cell division ATP-binding protein FtsE [Corynebacterium yudongzhengii]